MQHSTHPLQYRVHKACISMIYEAGREVGVSLFLLPADPLAVELLGGGPLGGLVVLEHGLRGAAEGAQAMMSII